MSQVKIDNLVIDSDFAQANSLPAKPVTVLDFVDVAVHRPVMEERWNYFVPREDAQTASEDTRVEVMRIREDRLQPLLDLDVVVLRPDLLQADDIVVT